MACAPTICAQGHEREQLTCADTSKRREVRDAWRANLNVGARWGRTLPRSVTPLSDVRFDFSAPFLRITPPDTNYGEAWEGLCCELLAAERPGHRLSRVASPDQGIDILDEDTGDAFQCKAAELGAAGTISATSSVESLRKAVAHRNALSWQKYIFATNGRYTGTARDEILQAAAGLGLSSLKELDFLGPEHWEQCCERHYERVKNRFYYRVTVGELEVIEALRQARYRPQYVSEFSNKINKGSYRVVITNNRTPVELEIPFSPDLSVKNCLDVAKELLGVSLEWTSFADLNTSAGPSVSLTINRYAQEFGKTLSELGVNSGDKIELWIKIVWRDGSEDATPSTSDAYVALRYAWSDSFLLRPSLDRGKLTVARKEALMQAMIWQATSKLASATTRGPAA